MLSSLLNHQRNSTSPPGIITCISALVVALTTMGCGPSYRSTGYLRNYDRLEFVGGNSDLAYALVNDGPIATRCDGIYLSPPIFRPRYLTKRPELRDEIREVLQQRLYYWMSTRYKDHGLQVSSTPPNTVNLELAGKKAYELETCVTEVKKGFGLARWILGFYLGATTFQVEGRIRSLPERKIIATFTYRLVFSGNSHTGLNPKSLFLRYCLRVSADWAGRDISELPERVFQQLEPLEPEE
jgi:hypothetical protein